MALWKSLAVICALFVHAESKWHHQFKREAVSSICDPIQNSTSKVHCYCSRLTSHPDQITSAECYQTHKNTSKNDPSWDEFRLLQNVTRLTLTNTRGVAMTFVPTNALKYTKAILRLHVKYCNIEKIEQYAFANLSLVEELTLRDNQIKILSPYAFAHHARVKTISLDQNEITEINRNVFVDLPSLEQLFLTENKIATIHDKAFVHLTNLKELEIDKNNIFSLNNETFSGLRNLEKLELGGNSLEVVGDNTFAPLINLRVLNLGDNKIQMLDEKAFTGLARLQILTMERNKLSSLENVKIFEELHGITSLNLKNNEITSIKPEAFLPILSNFYGKTSQLNIDGNKLRCDCKLDVFRPILNKTQNERLSTDLHNLQCHPSDDVKQKWDKIQETSKTSGLIFDDIEAQGDNAAYEYYDETDLNGTIFYFDMRYILNCSSEEKDEADAPRVPESSMKSVPVSTTTSHNEQVENSLSTKVTPSPVTNIKLTTVKPVPKKYVPLNKGTLDLALADSTDKVHKETSKEKKDNKVFTDEKVTKEKHVYNKDNVYTTSRLATVSAKPVENKVYDDHDMASDEAKPDRLKAHRSIQEEEKEALEHHSNAYKNNYELPLIISTIFSLRLFL